MRSSAIPDVRHGEPIPDVLSELPVALRQAVQPGDAPWVWRTMPYEWSNLRGVRDGVVRSQLLMPRLPRDGWWNLQAVRDDVGLRRLPLLPERGWWILRGVRDDGGQAHQQLLLRLPVLPSRVALQFRVPCDVRCARLFDPLRDLPAQRALLPERWQMVLQQLPILRVLLLPRQRSNLRGMENVISLTLAS